MSIYPVEVRDSWESICLSVCLSPVCVFACLSGLPRQKICLSLKQDPPTRQQQHISVSKKMNND